MKKESYARSLNTPVLVRKFLQKVLELDYDPSSNIEQKIADGELGISESAKFNKDTYDWEDYRSEEYFTDQARWALRQRIVEELLTLPRLGSDDDIKLGVGGACPNGELRAERQLFIVIGLPASGKSGIATTFADKYGAIIIDSDYAKRKLPEFGSHYYGASLVNKESSRIVNAFTDPPPRFANLLSLQQRAMANGYNIVLPKIGNDLGSLVKIATTYQQEGYKIHLTLINLDRVKATQRAVTRYMTTSRYVPLGLIFDDFGNDPIVSYYQLKSHFGKLFSSFGVISTDVPMGAECLCLEYTRDNPAQIYTMGIAEKILIKE